MTSLVAVPSTVSSSRRFPTHSALACAIALLVLPGLVACHDQPTEPVPGGPSLVAVHGPEGVPAPSQLAYALREGELLVTWQWGDEREWDLVTFELTVDGRKAKGDWSIKPYALLPGGISVLHRFSYSERRRAETVPDLCVSVMAKEQALKGVPSTTYHSKNCDPSLMPPPPTSSGPHYDSRRIVVGGNYACALTDAGSAFCWGGNSSGQLGDGTQMARWSPTPVAGGRVFASIAAGYEYTCGVSPMGQAYCWGGIAGSVFFEFVPTAVGQGLSFTQISIAPGSGTHACGVTTSGVAYCWGSNRNGEIGDGTTTTRGTPTRVTAGLAFVQISSGNSFTCALTPSGVAYCWGDNSHGQLGKGQVGPLSKSPSRVTGGLTFRQISAADRGTCAIATSGVAYCWGGAWGPAPALVAPGISFNEVTLSPAGPACGLTPANTVQCWTQVSPPAALPGNMSFLQIDGRRAGLASYFCGLATTGFHCWSGTETPGPILTALPMQQIAAGGEHTCGLRPDGKAFCWGSNLAGQIGDGTTTQRLFGTEVAYGPFTQLSSGWSHSCAVTGSGAALCWGSNHYGQLGDGTVSEHYVPTLVSGGTSFVQVSTGSEHSCGLSSAGAAHCWGSNGFGQLGDDGTSSRATPAAVAGGLAFTKISAGTSHTCALTAAGTPFCWGRYGGVQQYAPTVVTGGPAFNDITSGDRYSCGLTGSGAVYCWGINANGELGNTNLTIHSTPTLVEGGLTFGQVRAGNNFTCGLTTGGQAYCWGWNGHGQLGDGTTLERHVPTAVATGWSFERIATGGNHACAARTAGETYCWGANARGQLGDMTTTDHLTPTATAGQIFKP
jgi:alpha-tubulin suppressor-like RCC1 family protein